MRYKIEQKTCESSLSAKALVIYLGYHTESEKYFVSIFMTTKYRQVKLEMTWAKINSTHVTCRFPCLSYLFFLTLINKYFFDNQKTNTQLGQGIKKVNQFQSSQFLP